MKSNQPPRNLDTRERAFSMDLLTETYIVLDVPEPFAGRVLELRRAARDDFRAALPAEITLIGSGGAGAIMPSESVARIVGAVRAAVESTGPSNVL